MALFKPVAQGPGGVPGDQDVDDDEADGEDCQYSAHSYGYQDLQLAVLYSSSSVNILMTN